MKKLIPLLILGIIAVFIIEPYLKRKRRDDEDIYAG